MPDQITGQEVEQTKVEETTTQLPGENKPTEVTQATGEQPVEGIPETASDRTKQEFEKLKQHNAELKAKLQALEGQGYTHSSVLDSLKPKAPNDVQLRPADYQYLNTQEVQETVQSLADENGYVDTALLEKQLRESNERAKRAEQSALAATQAVQQWNENEQVRRTHSAFPQLDPSNPNFDERFFKLVRNEMTGQMMEGKQDFYSAAENMYNSFYKPFVQEPQKAHVEAQQQQVQQNNTQIAKEQINAGQPQSTASSRDDLLARANKGDTTALGELLTQSGY